MMITFLYITAILIFDRGLSAPEDETTISKGPYTPKNITQHELYNKKDKDPLFEDMKNNEDYSTLHHRVANTEEEVNVPSYFPTINSQSPRTTSPLAQSYFNSSLYASPPTTSATIATHTLFNRVLRRSLTTPLPKPYFDPSSPTNISVQIGMHAFLPCIIRNMNNNSISWIRSRDSHILSVDRYTFIADERFQTLYEEDLESWTLQVKYVQERDAGRYECQISTEPKMSHFIQFNVVTPLVQIPGGPDIYVKSGSPVTLKCIITRALILPEYIFWYQGSERVLTEASGERQEYVEKTSEDTTIGTLLISTTYPKDQGAYTCVPASLPTAAVTLHVLNGEHPAAMYHGGATSINFFPSIHLLLACLIAACLTVWDISAGFFSISTLLQS